MGFILDGQPAGSYVFASRSSTEEFLYNATVYENFNLDPPTSLPGGVHNLTIQSFTSMQFDHATYTLYVHSSLLPHPESPAMTPSSQSIQGANIFI